MNRVNSATAGTLWGNQFVYDRYGNLLQKVLTAGTGESLVVTVDPTTNRVQGPVYDAAGDMTNDTFNVYTYNAENKVTSAAPVGGGTTTTFAYDGDGVRVQKSGWRLYFPGAGTEPMAETYLDGTSKKEYIYFAGRRIALVDLAVSGTNCAPECQRYYFYGDHLDSANVVTDTTSGTVAESDYFPFGGERVVTSSSINPHFKFTSKEWDPEDNLDHFLFRDYSSRLGRFMSPDLRAGDVGNPQSLNRYAYVGNNPLNLTDPLGLGQQPVYAPPDNGGWTSLDLLVNAADGAYTIPGGIYQVGEGTVEIPDDTTIFPFASFTDAALFVDSVWPTSQGSDPANNVSKQYPLTTQCGSSAQAKLWALSKATSRSLETTQDGADLRASRSRHRQAWVPDQQFRLALVFSASLRTCP